MLVERRYHRANDAPQLVAIIRLQHPFSSLYKTSNSVKPTLRIGSRASQLLQVKKSLPHLTVVYVDVGY
jgi:hypothetical protein